MSGHITFGSGGHFCMGYQLIRSETEMVTAQFLWSALGIRLTEDVLPKARFFDRLVARLQVVIGKS